MSLLLCLSSESDTSPVVIFCRFSFCKTIFFSLCNEQWYIFKVETTEYECCSVVHHCIKLGNIFKQNVAVDVGYNNIKEATNMRKRIRVAMQNLNVLCVIQFCIVLTIFNTPFINVISYNLFCA